VNKPKFPPPENSRTFGFAAQHVSPSQTNGYSSPSPGLSVTTTWIAKYRLQLGAKPVHLKNYHWKCSNDCKKKQEIVTFKDRQGTEKHVLRDHPDPLYCEFLCLKCRKVKCSPQQILDHLGQPEKNGGHGIKGQTEKNYYIRAVHTETKQQSRIFRDKKEFAWYICDPLELSANGSRSSSPAETVTNKPSNQDNSETSMMIEDDCSSETNPIKTPDQNNSPGRPPDSTSVSNSLYNMNTGHFSAVPGG